MAETRAVSVLAIIVSYRTGELVARSLATLAKEREHARTADVSLSAFVVDNASGDGDTLRRAIAEHGWESWVTLVEAERNGGFAYGNNLGFRHGFGCQTVPDYFYLLNPDTEVREGAVSRLVRFMDARPDAGMAGSSLEDRHGELWPYAFRFPTFWSEVAIGASMGLVTRLLANRVVARQMGSDPEQVDWFPGASMMIRRQVVEELGGMDEAYFLYFEETDFCLKAKAAGYTAWYVPDSRVMHIAGASTGVTGTHETARRLPGYWFESRRRYFAKNHGIRYALVTDVVSVLAHLVGRAKRTLLRRRRENVPRFVGDLLRHSVVRKANRPLVPPTEFKPGAFGRSD